MCCGCLREVRGTLARRPAQMEGPAAGRQPAQIALSPLGAPSRGSSPRTRARGAAEAMGRRPCPARARELPIPTRFSRPARCSVTASAEASGGARVPARGCLGRQPRRPGRRRRSPAPVRSSRTPTAAPPGLPAGSHRPLRLRGPVCPQTGSLDLPLGVTSGKTDQGGGGKRPCPGPPRAPPGGPAPVGGIRVPPRHLHESARTPGPVAGASEPAARPRIYIFPSLGSGVRSCILMRS